MRHRPYADLRDPHPHSLQCTPALTEESAEGHTSSSEESSRSGGTETPGVESMPLSFEKDSYASLRPCRAAVDIRDLSDDLRRALGLSQEFIAHDAGSCGGNQQGTAQTGRK